MAKNPNIYKFEVIERIITEVDFTTKEEVVEFAVKLPNDEKTVYLPIDSKFPSDAYAKLMDAYEENDQTKILQAQKELDIIIKKSAKDIHDKYIYYLVGDNLKLQQI